MEGFLLFTQLFLYSRKDGSELKVTPYADGSGYKYDYYPTTTYGNASHDSTHIQADSSGNWSRTDNDRSSGSKSSSSGSGCYLTSACMKHYSEEFDDNCYELSILRWFRDTFVSKSDIAHYYEIAPTIVDNIEKLENNENIFNYIYDTVIAPCVKAIEMGDFEFAYKRYKSSILCLEEEFGTKEITKGHTKSLGAIYKTRMA